MINILTNRLEALGRSQLSGEYLLGSENMYERRLSIVNRSSTELPSADGLEDIGIYKTLIMDAAERLPQFLIESKTGASIGETLKSDGSKLYLKLWILVREMNEELRRRSTDELNFALLETDDDDEVISFVIGSTCHILSNLRLMNSGLAIFLNSFLTSSDGEINRINDGRGRRSRPKQITEERFLVILKPHHLIPYIRYLGMFPRLSLDSLQPGIWDSLFHQIQHSVSQVPGLSFALRNQLTHLIIHINPPTRDKILKLVFLCVFQ